MFVYKQWHGRAGHPLYRCWRSMMHRCYNVANKRHPKYGGRGIKVCERWHDIENFIEDMGARPEGLQIDRIDNDGDYEPGNCRWATHTDQQRNRSITKLNADLVRWIRYYLEEGWTQAALADKFGVTRPVISKIHTGKAWVGA